MRHSSTLVVLVLAASVAHGQTSSGHADVKQVLREALELQAPMSVSPPRLPERISEPARTMAPVTKPSPAPASRLSGEVIERAGRMATQVPAAAPSEPTRMGAAAARAANASQSAAGQEQAETARQNRPPSPGTPGGPRDRPPTPPRGSPQLVPSGDRSGR